MQPILTGDRYLLTGDRYLSAISAELYLTGTCPLTGSI